MSQLTLAWLKSLKGPEPIPLTLSSSWSGSLAPAAGVAGAQELSVVMTLRYLSYDYTARRPVQLSATAGIFGVAIEDVCQREKRPVPYLVSCCVREVERRGLDVVGIYRVSGLATDITRLRKAFDTRQFLRIFFPHLFRSSLRNHILQRRIFINLYSKCWISCK